YTHWLTPEGYKRALSIKFSGILPRLALYHRAYKWGAQYGGEFRRLRDGVACRATWAGTKWWDHASDTHFEYRQRKHDGGRARAHARVLPVEFHHRGSHGVVRRARRHRRAAARSVAAAQGLYRAHHGLRARLRHLSDAGLGQRTSAADPRA